MKVYEDYNNRNIREYSVWQGYDGVLYSAIGFKVEYHANENHSEKIAYVSQRLMYQTMEKKPYRASFFFI